MNLFCYKTFCGTLTNCNANYELCHIFDKILKDLKTIKYRKENNKEKGKENKIEKPLVYPSGPIPPLPLGQHNPGQPTWPAWPPLPPSPVPPRGDTHLPRHATPSC